MSNTLVIKNSVSVDGASPSIMVLEFQKFFGDEPDGSVAPGTVIGPGQEISIPFQGGSGSGDYYSFSIYWEIRRAGSPLSEYMNAIEVRKRCDVERDDIDSPFPTVVEFFAQSFNVGTPVSSGCFNNAYGQTILTPIPPM